MPHLLLKDLPRYECLLECAKKFPALNPSACESFLHLLRAGDEAFRVIDAHFNARGLSQGRFTVLMLLFDQNNGSPHALTPAQLAEQSGVTRATMTGLIDTLERDGMVVRTPDRDDRRQVSVQLTPHGLDFLQSMLPDHFARINTLLAPLSETERRTLVKLLGKITDRALETFPPSAEAALGAHA
jgi:DNA-binding MarR family transcriptional regulator